MNVLRLITAVIPPVHKIASKITKHNNIFKKLIPYEYNLLESNHFCNEPITYVIMDFSIFNRVLGHPVYVSEYYRCGIYITRMRISHHAATPGEVGIGMKLSLIVPEQQ